MREKQPCRVCGSSEHAARVCAARKRSGKHKPKPRRILAFDCETNSAGIVLFLASDSARQVHYLYDGAGLALPDLLAWLITVGSGKLCFGFYFDYDANQLIRQLPHSYQGQLAARGYVTWRQWKIRHVPGKRFAVSDRMTGKSVTIWDVSGWAQCSFVRLCDDWKLGTESERAAVAVMKARRGDFDNATETELVEYTTLECALLADWVQTILALHESCGIKLRAYSGPGSTASALIRERGWKPPALPPEVQSRAADAFFGGRSEISCIGPVAGPIHSYDINSAYPRAIAELPELAGARWFRVRKFHPGMWGFYRVRWDQPKRSCWGLFPLRGARLPGGRRSLSLLYPRTGEGTYHSIEVEAAMNAAPGCVRIVDGIVIEPRGRPFEWIHEEAARRLEYKAAADPRAFPLKVGLNSIYGKLAQHTGQAPLQCLAYAAAVTAHTRAQLMTLAVANQHDVLLLATDGILSRVPLPVEVGAGLGQWEYQELPDAWLLQAGVYWAGGKKRTRGIDARGLAKEDVETAWRRRKTRAEIVLQARRVLSYRLCCAQRKQELTGTWHESTRTVRFDPYPRRKPYRWEDGRLLTLPAPVAEYRLQAALDEIVAGNMEGSQYDELEALPDWAFEE